MTQIVSSISGLPIYAPSAAYAPTNGADVSAIASAYAESAASGKQDSGSYLSSTDASAFYPSTANPSGYLTTLPADLVYSADLSAYAYESSNSAKLDSTAFSTVSGNFLTSETVTATAGDGVYITSINGMGLSGQGGGSVTSPSGTILVNGSEIEGTDSAVVGGGGSDYESGLVISLQNNSQYVQNYNYSPDAVDEPSIIFSSNVGAVYVTASTSPNYESVSTAFYNDYGTIKFTGTDVYIISYTASSWIPFSLDVYTASGTPPYEYVDSADVFPGSLTYRNYQLSDSTSDKDLIVSSISNFGAWAVSSERYDQSTATASGNYNESARINIGEIDYLHITASADNQTVQSLVFYTGIHGAATGGEVVKLAHESAVVPWSAIEGNNGYVTAISGSSLSAQGGGGVITSITLTANPNGYGSSIRMFSDTDDSYPTYAYFADYAISDESGRTLSALPGSSEVSSIASSIASAYQVVSSVGDDGTYITSINGSALSGVGGGGTSPVTSIESAKLTARTAGIGSTATAAITAISGENGSAFATQYILPNAMQMTGSNILAFSPSVSMWTTGDYATGVFAPLKYGTGAGLFMNVGSFKGYIKGNEYFVSNDQYGYTRGESHNSRGNRVVVQSTSSASAEIYAKGDTAEIHLGTTNGTAKIDTADINNWNSTYNTVSSNSSSWGAGASEATVSSIASSYAESAASSKVDKTAYDNLYSAFTAVSSMLNTYSSYFSSISAKVDSSAIGVEE